ncbi:MAG: hypothetical protein AAF541_05725 [Pseudomonadota bacterium]
MKKILKVGLYLFIALMSFTGAIFYLIFFSERPAIATDPAALAGDGSLINYCNLTDLDGSGLTASEIPKGNTPGCSYTHFPLPLLSSCTEPLPEGAADLRGLWRGISGRTGHIERVEQCGARTVVTSSGLIHDSGPNSSGGFTTNDTEGAVLFTIGDQEYCPRTSAGMTWNQGILEFRVLGWGPIVVRRYLDGEHMIWEYADGSVTRLERICYLPDAHRVPTPRGWRLELFPD